MQYIEISVFSFYIVSNFNIVRNPNYKIIIIILQSGIAYTKIRNKLKIQTNEKNRHTHTFIVLKTRTN